MDSHCLFIFFIFYYNLKWNTSASSWSLLSGRQNWDWMIICDAKKITLSSAAGAKLEFSVLKLIVSRGLTTISASCAEAEASVRNASCIFDFSIPLCSHVDKSSEAVCFLNLKNCSCWCFVWRLANQQHIGGISYCRHYGLKSELN